MRTAILLALLAVPILVPAAHAAGSTCIQPTSPTEIWVWWSSGDCTSDNDKTCVHFIVDEGYLGTGDCSFVIPTG